MAHTCGLALADLRFVSLYMFLGLDLNGQTYHAMACDAIRPTRVVHGDVLAKLVRVACFDGHVLQPAGLDLWVAS